MLRIKPATFVPIMTESSLIVPYITHRNIPLAMRLINV